MSPTIEASGTDHLLARFRERIRAERPVQRIGHVVRVAGLIIESEGPNLALGDVCEIHPSPGEPAIHAEVVGFRDHRLLLMPLGETHNLRTGSKVCASAFAGTAPVGNGLMGRTLDGLGQPIDGRGALVCERSPHLHNKPPNALRR